MLPILSVFPLVIEAISIAYIAKALYGMPINLCYAFGFMNAPVGNEVYIPVLSDFLRKGYGLTDGVSHELIVAS